MSESGVVLAVDYGLARTGLARSDETGSLAIPLGTIVRTGDRRLAEEVARRALQVAAVVIVVGFPHREDGRETPVIAGIRRFARHLEKRIEVPVVFVDESGSTAEAEDVARRAGMPRGRRETMQDALAAACLLRRYLDERPGTGAVT